MIKNILIIGGVGVGFLYLIVNFISNVNQGEQLASIVPAGNNGYATQITDDDMKRFYTKDATGSEILDLNNMPLEQAKSVWIQSSVKDKVLSLFPNFNYMRDQIKLKVREGKFREYLLRKLDEVESDYLSGSIDSLKAQEMISNLD